MPHNWNGKMNLPDIITLADGERFAVGYATLASLTDRPARCDFGIIMLCRSGSATLMLDVLQLQLSEGAEVIVQPGKIMNVKELSDDFKVEYVAFTRELYEEATFRMDMVFYKFLADNPLYRHNEDSIKRFDVWIASLWRVYEDREHMFRDTIVRNLLQNVFLTIYDTLRRRAVTLTGDFKGRQGELFHKYMTLVRENFREHHNVSYYADRLCITTRYLSTIVRSVSGGSPKDIIDNMIVLEARVLLCSTNLSVQEIAQHLHFPDQSYLGRYFRKHTGESPTEYRNNR